LEAVEVATGAAWQHKMQFTLDCHGHLALSSATCSTARVATTNLVLRQVWWVLLLLAAGVGEVMAGKLLLFDALSGRFTTIKLRGKAAGCVACGSSATISKATIASYDHAAFHGGQSANDGPPVALDIVPVGERLSAVQLRQKLDQAAIAVAGHQHQQQAASSSNTACGVLPANGADDALGGAEASATGYATDAGAAEIEQHMKPLLLDVRPAEQFAIMSIPGAVNVPFLQLEQKLPHILQLCGSTGQQAPAASSPDAHTSAAATGGEEQHRDGTRSSRPAVYVLCRRGNHSQLAVQRLREAGVVQAVDVIGGYEAWAAEARPWHACLVDRSNVGAARTDLWQQRPGKILVWACSLLGYRVHGVWTYQLDTRDPEKHPPCGYVATSNMLADVSAEGLVYLQCTLCMVQ